MIDAVFLYVAQDADAAKRLAAAWPGSGAVATEIAHGKRVMSFGRHMLVCAIWTGAANGEDDGEALAAALLDARRRGIVLLWKDQSAPKALSQGGAPVVAGIDGETQDGAQLLAIAHNMNAGAYLPPPSLASPRPRRAAPARRTTSAAPRQPKPQFEAPDDPRAGASRRHWIGFVLGAGLGAALFFGFAAPRLSSWLGMLTTPEAPPPSLLSAEAPPLRGLSEPPQESAPPTDNAPP